MKGILDTIQLKYIKSGSHWQLPACNLLVNAPSSGIGNRGTNSMPKYHEKGLVLLWSRTRKNCSSLTRGFSWSRMRKIVQVLVLK